MTTDRRWFAWASVLLTGCGAAGGPAREGAGPGDIQGSDAAAGVDLGGKALDATTDATGAPGFASPPDAGGAGGSEAGGGVETHEAGGSTGLWVMGYYSGWNAADLPVNAIDWAGLTHIATAFMIPDAGGFTASDDPNDPSFDPNLATAVIAAAHAAGKKAIASIGGSNSATAFEGATSSANIDAFVASLGALVTTTGYDGIDIDWEGGPTSDDTLLLDLLRRLRAGFPSAILTMTAGSINNNLVPTDLSSLYAAAAPSVDRIDLMTYGMSGAFQGWKSWHSSPLHWNLDSATPTGIDDTVARYIDAGVPAAKLGVGSGFYGECYTAPVTAPDEALGDSTVAASDGVISYQAIMSTYYSSTARQWDPGAMVPYLTLSGSNPEGCTYLTYEDAQSISAKGAWVKAQGLGGVIIWTINEGYLAGADAGSRNPLLDAMQASFLQ